MQQPILLVIAKGQLTRRMLRACRDAGWELKSAELSSAALEAAMEEPPSAILVDAREDSALAAQLCLSLRSIDKLKLVPLIALARARDAHERLLTLQVGADVCFADEHGHELSARLANIQRRLRAAISKSRMLLQFHDLELDLNGYTIRSKNGFAHLSVLQLKVLKYLMGRSEGVVSRRELMENVWGYTELDERSVSRQVARLGRILISTQSEVSICWVRRPAGYRLAPTSTPAETSDTRPPRA